jgi:hypothetical protein
MQDYRADYRREAKMPDADHMMIPAIVRSLYMIKRNRPSLSVSIVISCQGALRPHAKGFFTLQREAEVLSPTIALTLLQIRPRVFVPRPSFSPDGNLTITIRATVFIRGLLKVVPRTGSWFSVRLTLLSAFPTTQPISWSRRFHLNRVALGLRSPVTSYSFPSLAFGASP